MSIPNIEEEKYVWLESMEKKLDEAILAHDWSVAEAIVADVAEHGLVGEARRLAGRFRNELSEHYD